MRDESVTKSVIGRGERKLRGRYTKLVKTERERELRFVYYCRGQEREVRAHIFFLSFSRSQLRFVYNIIQLLYKRLMIYGRVGSEELGENYHTLPLF